MKQNNNDIKLFGWIWAFMLSVLSISKYLKGHFTEYLILLIAAIIVFAINFFKPSILKPIHWLLSTLWKGFMRIMTALVLSITYYAVLVPIGLIMRFTGKDLLDVKLNPKSETYWKEREVKVTTKEMLERQF